MGDSSNDSSSRTPDPLLELRTQNLQKFFHALTDGELFVGEHRTPDSVAWLDDLEQRGHSFRKLDLFPKFETAQRRTSNEPPKSGTSTHVRELNAQPTASDKVLTFTQEMLSSIEKEVLRGGAAIPEEAFEDNNATYFPKMLMLPEILRDSPKQEMVLLEWEIMWKCLVLAHNETPGGEFLLIFDGDPGNGKSRGLKYLMRRIAMDSKDDLVFNFHGGEGTDTFFGVRERGVWRDCGLGELAGANLGFNFSEYNFYDGKKSKDMAKRNNSIFVTSPKNYKNNTKQANGQGYVITYALPCKEELKFLFSALYPECQTATLLVSASLLPSYLQRTAQSNEISPLAFHSTPFSPVSNVREQLVAFQCLILAALTHNQSKGNADLLSRSNGKEKHEIQLYKLNQTCKDLSGGLGLAILRFLCSLKKDDNLISDLMNIPTSSPSTSSSSSPSPSQSTSTSLSPSTSSPSSPSTSSPSSPSTSSPSSPSTSSPSSPSTSSPPPPPPHTSSPPLPLPSPPPVSSSSSVSSAIIDSTPKKIKVPAWYVCGSQIRQYARAPEIVAEARANDVYLAVQDCKFQKLQCLINNPSKDSKTSNKIVMKNTDSRINPNYHFSSPLAFDLVVQRYTNEPEIRVADFFKNSMHFSLQDVQQPLTKGIGFEARMHYALTNFFVSDLVPVFLFGQEVNRSSTFPPQLPSSTASNHSCLSPKILRYLRSFSASAIGSLLGSAFYSSPAQSPQQIALQNSPTNLSLTSNPTFLKIQSSNPKFQNSDANFAAVKMLVSTNDVKEIRPPVDHSTCASPTPSTLPVSFSSSSALASSCVKDTLVWTSPGMEIALFNHQYPYLYAGGVGRKGQACPLQGLYLRPVELCPAFDAFVLAGGEQFQTKGFTKNLNELLSSMPKKVDTRKSQFLSRLHYSSCFNFDYFFGIQITTMENISSHKFPLEGVEEIANDLFQRALVDRASRGITRLLRKALLVVVPVHAVDVILRDGEWKGITKLKKGKREKKDIERIAVESFGPDGIFKDWDVFLQAYTNTPEMRLLLDIQKKLVV